MRTAAGGKSETSPAENIDAILRVEKQDKEALAVHHRFFHWIGWFVGTIQSISFQCAFVFCWIAFILLLTTMPSMNIRFPCWRRFSPWRPFSLLPAC